jgi:hypothetical protein
LAGSSEGGPIKTESTGTVKFGLEVTRAVSQSDRVGFAYDTETRTENGIPRLSRVNAPGAISDRNIAGPVSQIFKSSGSESCIKLSNIVLTQGGVPYSRVVAKTRVKNGAGSKSSRTYSSVKTTCLFCLQRAVTDTGVICTGGVSENSAGPETSVIRSCGES